MTQLKLMWSKPQIHHPVTVSFNFPALKWRVLRFALEGNRAVWPWETTQTTLLLAGACRASTGRVNCHLALGMPAYKQS